MDLEGLGGGGLGLPIDPKDFVAEIAESVENLKRSIGRRDAETEWAMEDLARAGDTPEAGMDFLMKVSRIEAEHDRRSTEAQSKLAANMALVFIQSEKYQEMGLPEPPEGLIEHLHELTGKPKEITETGTEPSGSAVIEGIGSFDDLPVVEDPPAEDGEA